MILSHVFDVLPQGEYSIDMKTTDHVVAMGTDLGGCTIVCVVGPCSPALCRQKRDWARAKDDYVRWVGLRVDRGKNR